jgi:HlyD family secretion protein
MTSPTPVSLDALAIDRSAAPIRRRKPFYKRVWVWLLALLAVALVAGFVNQRGKPQPVELTTVVASWPSQGFTLLNATGRVVAQRRASISSKATGRLEWLGVQEGQKVTEGEVIARLENRDVGATREQAAAGVAAARANLVQGQAELADAEQALGRARELAARSFISDASVDTAQARVNKARAAIETLRAQIAVAEANLRAATVAFEQTMIRAPFTGLVLTKNANVGDILTPFSSAAGTTGAVVTMADMATLEVEADVSETSIGRIRVGAPAEIQLDAFADLRLAASVSRIVPTVDRSKATLLVKLRFDERDARVLPDMSAKIAFLERAVTAEERKPVPALRAEAIASRDGRDVVFVASEVNANENANGKANEKAGEKANDKAAGAAAAPLTVKLTPVTRGAMVGDLVRVDALAAGTRVVLNPAAELADGARVAPVKK